MKRNPLCYHRPWRHLTSAAVAALMGAIQAGAAAVPAGPQAAALPGASAQSAGAMSDIHDIKPLIPLDNAASLLVYLLAAVAALLLAGGLAYALKRRRKPRASAAPAPVPPEKAALDQLAVLAAADNVDGRTFYFRLSFILRTYLEARYGINAVEMTTEELVTGIAPLPLPGEMIAPLETLLKEADPVKFAGAPAVRRRMESDLAFARRFVEKTAAPQEISAGGVN